MESDEPFIKDRNLRIDIVVRKGGLQDVPKREHRYKSIQLDVTHHAERQAQVHLRGGGADRDGSAATTSEARSRRHRRSTGTRVLRRAESQT